MNTDGWTMAWLLWIAMFFAIEGPAIANRKPGDTLSEHVWKWFMVSAPSKQWRIRRGTLVAFLAWLSLHFLTGGKF